MDGKILLAGLVAFLIVLAGCASNNSYNACCMRYYADAEHRCLIQDGTQLIEIPAIAIHCPYDPEDEVLGNMCEVIVGYENEAELPLDGFAGNPILANYTICAQATPDPCPAGKCDAMVCGVGKYNPRPLMSANDSTRAATGRIGADSSLSSSVPQEELVLYGTTCNFVPLKSSVASKIRRSRGRLWLNTIRFGVGNNFSDFEWARNYFPPSDAMCFGAQDGDLRERFMNYLNRPSSYCTSYPASSPRFLCEPSLLVYADASSCARDCVVNGEPVSCSSVPAETSYRCDYQYTGIDAVSTCAAACGQACEYTSPRWNCQVGPNIAATYGDGTACSLDCLNFGGICTGEIPEHYTCGRLYQNDNACGGTCPGSCGQIERSYCATDGLLHTSEGACENQCPIYDSSQCTNAQVPFFVDNPGIADDGEYQYTTNVYWAASSCYNHGKDDCGNICKPPESPATAPPPGTSCYEVSGATEVNADYYLDWMDAEYENQIWAGHENQDGNWVPGAEFECSDNGQCYSGYCNKQGGYVRDACIPRDDSEALLYDINCGCSENLYEQSTECSAGPQFQYIIVSRESPSSPYYIEQPLTTYDRITLTSDTEEVVAYTLGSPQLQLMQGCQIRSNPAYIRPFPFVSSTPNTTDVFTTDANGDDYIETYTNKQTIGLDGAERLMIITSTDATVYQTTITSITAALNAGICENDGTSRPSIRTYGWCEPCTVSTLAYQKVSQRENYCPRYEQRNSNDDNVVYGGLDMTTWCGEYAERDERCTSNVLGIRACNDGPFGWPGTDPDYYYLQKKMDNYLKSGVMPVLDTSSLEFYVLYEGHGIFLPDKYYPYKWPNRERIYVNIVPDSWDDVFLRWIGDRGAITAIVGEASRLGTPAYPNYPSGPSYEELLSEKLKAYAAKCPKCISAITLGDVTDANIRDDTVEDLSDFFGRQPPIAFGDPYLNPNGKRTELIAYEYIWGASGECSDYTKPTTELLNFSTMMLELYRKPTIVSNFSLSSWCNGEQKRLALEFLFNHTSDLADAGIVGIIYRNYNSPPDSILDPPPNPQQGDTFCALQQESQQILGLTASSVYFQTPAVESCECSPCTEFEVAQGLCDRSCEAGGICEIPKGGDPAAQYKCLDSCVRASTCTLCSDIPSKRATCSIQSAQETRRISIPLNELSDLYRDVIASLPNEDKCCLLETVPGTDDLDTNSPKYTYIKREGTRQNLEQLIYSHTGDLSVTCGQSPVSAGVPNDVIQDKIVRCTVSG